MKVKIIKSGSSIYWYNSRIGEVFNAIENDDRCILPSCHWKYLVDVMGTGDFGSGVVEQDCEIVEEKFVGLEEAYNDYSSWSIKVPAKENLVSVDGYPASYYTYPKTKQPVTTFTIATESSQKIERITKAMKELFQSNIEPIDVERVVKLYHIFEEK